MGVVGGFLVGADARVHTTFGHNPSSLRLCSFDPNLQNIPRGTDDASQKWVKEIFVAPPGACFWERDFSAIEAVLVGYFAGSARYARFARLGVHDYLASHILGRPADLGWSDDDIRRYFGEIKKKEKAIRDVAKRIVHASNYMATARKIAYEYPEQFASVKEAARLQGVYFDLFPEIRRWHTDLCRQVDGTKQRGGAEAGPVDPWTLGVCYARNPFGYVHRFYDVLHWEKVDGQWYSTFGEDAKRLVSFLPQSTAAGIIKQAAKTLYYDYPWVGASIRLLIHDSILGECPTGDVERALEVSRAVMEAPIPQLPLDPSWGMGEFLTIGTEAKTGTSWGDMR